MARRETQPMPEPSWIRDFLADLVRVRSDRPQDRRPMADWMESRLAALGARVSRHGARHSPALLARFGRTDGGVVFSGHLDTVPVTGTWTSRPGEVRGNRLFGRGSTDMKGGVTALLWAATDLAKRDLPFSLALTTDEETSMEGARALSAAPALEHAAAIVVAEPTSLKVGLSEKAALFLRLTTAGRSGHASMPWTGISANARMLSLLETLRRAFPSRDRDGITFNVGRVEGGLKPNIIADRCEALLDFRVPGATTPAAHEARARAVLRAAAVPFRLERQHFVTALRQDERQPLLRRFESLARRPRATIYFATEAAVFSKLRRPLIIFGPGAQERCHVTDEWVSLPEVRTAARLYRDFALAVGERP